MVILWWVSDCCLTTKWEIFQLYHGKNKLHSMRWLWFPFYTRPTRCVGFLVLAHWNNSPCVNMSLHSNTLSRFQVNKSLLFLLNVACGEATNTNLIVSYLTWQRSNCTTGEHINHCTTDAVCHSIWISMLI